MIKCVKVQSKKLNNEQLAEIQALCDSTQSCKNMFFDRFGGIGYMSQIESFQKMRDSIKKEEKHFNVSYAQMFGFQQRHWIMALSDVCSNLNSNWSNLSNLLKTKIRDNETMSDSEKAYCRYIVSSTKHWQQVLLKEEIVPNTKLSELLKNIDPSRLKTIHNIIRRYTRNYKFNKPHTENLTVFSLDQEMYSIKYDKNTNKTYIYIASTTKNKRIQIELKSPYSYSKNGNIQIVFLKDKKCIEIHKSIKIKPKKNKRPVNFLGLDKGYSTLMSCSDHTEYGVNIGKEFTKEAERINKRNSNRNPYFNKRTEMRNEIKTLDVQIDNTKDGIQKIRLIQRKKSIEKKLERFEQQHIGNKNYDKQHNKTISHLESTINYEIKKMINQTGVTHLVIEDLSFVNNMSPHKGKKFNRQVSSWLKGTLDERIEYICELNNVTVFKVNPAYTSQYCAQCGAKIERSGTHNEIATCPHCGKMNANINAAKEILLRLFDDEITLYTPYKKVKEIIENRKKLIKVTYQEQIDYVKSNCA
jgi:IS605 OrfB family transposase